jgi:hypothetical protein
MEQCINLAAFYAAATANEHNPGPRGFLVPKLSDGDRGAA